MPRVKAKRAKKRVSRAIVFCVPSFESASGYHDVSWAADGDLNKADRRGHVRRFRSGRAGWERAKAFARAKAKTLGVKASIHPY